MTTKITAFGEVMMRLSAPNHLKLQQTNTLDVIYTGTGVNVLSGLSNFGYETSLVTKLSNNNVGDAAVAHIRSLGIATEDVTRGGEYLGMYFLEQGFDIRPTQVTYSNRIESSFCQSTIADYDLDEIFSQTSTIHFCGITLAISDHTRNMVLHIAKEAKKRGITIVFDCNYRPKLWNHTYDEARKWYEQMLPYVDICMMTDRDAEFVLGMTTDYQDQKDKLADLLPRVAKTYDISYLAGTIRGGQTLQGFLCYQSVMHYSKKYTFNVLDRIGGGDGFASGIIYGHHQQLANEEIVEFATAAGVLTHTTHGDSPLNTTEDVWALVNQDQAGGPEVKR